MKGVIGSRGDMSYSLEKNMEHEMETLIQGLGIIVVLGSLHTDIKNTSNRPRRDRGEYEDPCTTPLEPALCRTQKGYKCRKP